MSVSQDWKSVGCHFHAQDLIPAHCDLWCRLYQRKLNTTKKGTNNKMLLIILALSYGKICLSLVERL